MTNNNLKWEVVELEVPTDEGFKYCITCDDSDSHYDEVYTKEEGLADYICKMMNETNYIAPERERKDDDDC